MDNELTVLVLLTLHFGLVSVVLAYFFGGLLVLTVHCDVRRRLRELIDESSHRETHRDRG